MRQNIKIGMRRFLASLLILTSFTTSSHALTNAETIVRASARKFGVPVELAIAVAKHESGILCGVVGSHGEVGPLQILPSTARGMGYRDIRHKGCAAQTDAGMAHLARCYRGMGGNRWAAAACHNQGFSAITGRIREQAKRYANKVMWQK